MASLTKKKKNDFSDFPDQPKEDFSDFPDQPQDFSDFPDQPKLEQPEPAPQPSVLDRLKDTFTKTRGAAAVEQPGPTYNPNADPLDRFLVGRPSEAAPVVREFLSDKLGGQEQDVLAQAEKTRKVPYGPILRKVVADTFTENLPLTPGEIALAAAIPKGIEAGSAALAETFPALAKPIGALVKDFVLTKNETVKITPQTIRDFYIFGKEKLDPKTYDLLVQLPKEDLIQALETGNELATKVKTPRFGAPKEPPVPEVMPGTPSGAPAAEQPLVKAEPNLGGGKPTVAETTAPVSPILSPKGAEYLKTEFPVLSQAVEALSPHIDPAALQKATQEATARAIEASIYGAPPEEAQKAALDHLATRAKEAPPAAVQPLKVDKERLPVHKPTAVVSQVDVGTGKPANITHQMVVNEAKAILQDELGSRGAASPLEEFVRSNGGVRGFKGGVEGEEFKGVPVHLRGPIAVDEMAQMAYNRGLLEEPSGDLLREKLKEIVPRGELPKVGQFYDQALRNLEYYAQEGVIPFEPTAAQQLGKQAAEKVLSANNLDDRTMVNLVKSIENDDTAFQAGRGRQFNANKEEIVGQTTTGRAGDRLQAVIDLAENATTRTGRHEAFHAVTNLALNDAEKQVLLSKYANMEDAADAFADFQAGQSTGDRLIDRVFAKLKQFLEKFMNAIRGRGYKSASEIFSDIDAGRFGSRIKPEVDLEKAFSARQNTFFSQVENTLAEKLPAKASGEQVAGLLRNAPGIKQEELDWIGLPEYLKDHPNVTKDELLKFVRENNVKIEEVLKGNLPFKPRWDSVGRDAYIMELGPEKGSIRIQKLEPNGRFLVQYPGGTQESFETLDLAKADAEDVVERMGAGNKDTTKFGRYVLPGGENYKELLLTLPSETSADSARMTAIEKKLQNPGDYDESELVVLRKQYKQLADKVRGSDFQSSHYSEPNILAHVRFNDRIDAEGKKVLFLEEVQSDWWAKNRKALGAITKPQSVGELAKKFFGSQISTMMPLKASDGGMLAMLENNQIRKEIITRIPVDVVDMLRGLQTSPEKIFSNDPMLTKPIPIKAGRRIGTAILDAMRSVGADLRTKLLDSQSAGSDIQLLPTLKASDLTSREVVGMLSPENIYHVGLPGLPGNADVASPGTEFPTLTAETRVNPNSFPTTQARPEESASLGKILNWHNKIINKTGASKQSYYLAAPFVGKTDSWMALSLKRMLRFAVDNGYDKIAWTTGAQQADRYDLAKQIDQLTATKAKDNGLFNITGMKDGQAILKEIDVKPEKLPDIIGKDLANKIANQEPGKQQVYSGVDLKVGGEGMKGFYDEILPSFLNKYTKKWGGRVGEAEINTGEGARAQERYDDGDINEPELKAALSQSNKKVHALEITPDMRESVLRGQPQFSVENRLQKQRAAEGMQAAVKDPETGEVYTGLSHSEILKNAIKEDPNIGARLAEEVLNQTGNVGFADEYGEFITRQKAERQFGVLNSEYLPQYSTEPLTPDSWDKIKQELYDRFDPIKYQKGKEISPDLKNAGGNYTRSYVLARELNGKIRGISESLLNDLNKSLKPLKNYEDRQILNKIYSLRNHADLDRLGKTTSEITATDAENQLSELKKKVGDERFTRISKVADELASIQNDKALQILVDGKVIKPETAKLLKERYPNYLRSETLDEILAPENPSFRRADNGEPIGKINRSFLKTKLGTVLKINDDVIGIVRRSLVTKVAAAQKQIVVDQIAQDFGKTIGNMAYKEGKLVTEVDPNVIPKGYEASKVKASGGRVFAVRKDIANLLDGLNQKEADFITKAISGYNRIFRAGATTLRVPFVFNNIFRDTQEAIFKARSIPGQNSQLMSYMKAIVPALKTELGISDATYDAWKKAGGAYGGIATSIPKEIPVPARIESQGKRLGRFAQNAVALPFEAVMKLASFSENTSRLAEWIRLEGAKIDPNLRALQTRDLTVDFEKVGDAMKRINQVIPFLNANVQGTVNNFRAFRDQPFVSLARMAAYVILPAVTLYEWNRKFKNDDDIDPYIKSNYWYVNSGMTVNQDGKEIPVLWTMRKGEFAKSISYFIDSLMEYAKKDPNFKQRLKDFSVQGSMDSMVSTVVPPLARVPIEEAANRNFWTSRPIVPQSLEEVAPEKQFKPGTTNTARRVGELTGASPVRFEHIATGLFPASRQILEASDVLFQPKPEFPRQNKRVFPIQSYVPIVQTPSGYFSQEEDIARDFEKKAKQDTRTKNFLFEQAARRYNDDRSEENRLNLQKYASQVDNRMRTVVFKKIAKEQAQKQMTSRERALNNLPKKLRGSYQAIQ